MSIKTLLLASIILSFGVSQASAQYLHHLQKFYQTLGGLRDSLDTKALTPVKQGRGLQWAFAASVASTQPGDTRLNSLLVKLRDNLPISDPFALDWAAEYFDPDLQATIEVQDVDYESGRRDRRGYILCGNYSSPFLPNPVGFLLRVDELGNPLFAKTYQEVSVFNSCVVKNDNNGYVAVGIAQYRNDPTDPFPTTRDAVYTDVDRNLQFQCALTMQGTFVNTGPPLGSNGIDSRWNKVIRYKSRTRGTGYAMVGDEFFNPNYQLCRLDQDVMVGLVGEQCNVQWVRQYGAPLTTQQRIFETGLSIAQYDQRRGGFVVTGEWMDDPCGGPFPLAEDVLVFRLRDNGDLIWMNHYDIERGGLPGSRDMGTAIQMSFTRRGIFKPQPGFSQSRRRKILVAGETETTYFQAGSSSPVTWDAFLMEINANGVGSAITDVFGFVDGVDNGALTPGKLDLHLTQDRHAVLMGNTKLSPDANTTSYPMLIERYQNPATTCKDKRQRTKRLTAEFPDWEVKVSGYEINGIEIQVQGQMIEMGEKPVCPKKPPPPTESPTGRPTPVPTPKPTLPRLPSIVSDEVFGEDVFEEEDVNEDVVKDDIIKPPEDGGADPKEEDSKSNP